MDMTLDACIGVRLGSAHYNIGMQHVHELRAYEPPTPVANAPACIAGVLHLRGALVPIVDLHRKLGCADAGCNDSKAIIVLHLRGRVVGAVVDAVCNAAEVGMSTDLDIETLMASADIGLLRPPV